MKRNSRNNLLASGLVLTVLLAASCNTGHRHEAHAETYTCPMHPAVISDRRGTCPVCGMDLVRKGSNGETGNLPPALAAVTRSPSQWVHSSVATVKATYTRAAGAVQATGMVTYDVGSLQTIAVRASGRIEKIYLRYPYQRVTKGQPVAQLYSPELVQAQRELLFVTENDSGNTTLLQAARNKLALLGLTPAQIDDLLKRRTPTTTITLYSAYDGYVVIAKPATIAPQVAQANSMNAMPRAEASTTGSDTTPALPMLREGAYVAAGQTLFNIVDQANLRLELDLPAAQAANVSRGDTLVVTLPNGTAAQATVDFIQPYTDGAQDLIKVRVYTAHASQLPVGQLVQVTVQLQGIESMWVPRQAVVDLGMHQVVFVKARGAFRPKRVSTGATVGKRIEIMAGLASADEIAASAQYLVDSESFINVTD